MGFSSKIVLAFFVMPVLASLLLNIIYQKPPSDHGKGTMFDTIATRYDFINRVLALNLDIGWRKVMISEVTSHGQIFEGKESVNILDLATGTADVAILMAKEYKNNNSPSKKGMKILGVDPSQNMINVGREKILKEKLKEEITLELGDARNLDGLASDQFNAATMSFGIRNVPEKELALCEIHRVLKKNEDSRLAILEFSEPGEEAGIMGAAARFFIRYAVPVIGAIISGAPRDYMHLQNSIKDFPSPQKFASIMEGLTCTSANGQIGTFEVEKIVQMNFGSVQLYLAAPIVV